MHDFTPLSALFGGVLIGLSATLLYFSHGRVAGISGIVSGLLYERPILAYRLLFVVGLLVVGLVAGRLWPAAFGVATAGWLRLVVAGLLVGYGTRLGSGCTSGHGVSGLARGALRSLVATVLFCAAGAATVTLLGRIGGR